MGWSHLGRLDVGTIILYGDLEGHVMKESSRETGRWDDNFVRRFERTWDEGVI